MADQRVKYASQADPEILERMREIAREDGRHFQAVMEDAMREYIERRQGETPREEVMARFRASVAKNRRLAELLSK